MNTLKWFWNLSTFTVVCCSFLLPKLAFSQGFVLPGAGPVNASMGGAAVAAPLDATGALHWNPASISGLKTSSVDIGAGLINVRHKAFSTVNGVTGSTRSNAGWAPLPAIGLVYKQPDSPITMGLGMNQIGGFFVNFPADASNPLFTAPPDGFGTVYSRFALLQVTPTVAYQLSDNVSVGVSPTVTIADLQVAPFAPGPPNQDGTYPDAYNSRLRYGMGIHAGIYVTTESFLDFGASVKSPQWFEGFAFNSTDSDGTAKKLSLDLEYPLIVSFGASYSGIEGLLVAADVRWLDYDSVPTFGDRPGFDANGGVTGLGWSSVFSLSLGAQYEIDESTSVRLGYSWNENPVSNQYTFFSLQAPSLQSQALSLGATKKLNDSLQMNVAWQRFFSVENSGPIYDQNGPIADTRIRIREWIDFIYTGVTVIF